MATQCKVLLKHYDDDDDDNDDNDDGGDGEGEKVEWRKSEQETKQEQPYIEPWTPECESTNARSTAAGFGLFPPTCA